MSVYWSVVVKPGGCDEQVLRLHVPMEVPGGMDVVEPHDDLAKDRGHKTTSKWFTFASLNELVEITLHGLKDEVEFLGVREEEEVVERNYVGVIRYRTQ